MCSKINEDQKYLYEKAIEGRRFHMECFNHWMNMYAIINGALFVGLYTVKTTSYTLSILVLGCLAGWFWFFSVCGFYRWIISWIRIVSHYEKKLFSSDKPEEQYLVYNIFDENMDKEKKDKKEEGKSKKKKLYPFSTQKITRAFAFCVAIVWTVLLAYSSVVCGLWESLPNALKSPVFQIALGVIMLIVIVIAILPYPIIAIKRISTLLYMVVLREDLSETHKPFDELEKES